MTSTGIRNRPTEFPHDDLSKVKAWKNLAFTTSGRSFLSKQTHQTEEAAKQVADTWVLKAHAICANGTLDVIDECTGEFLFVFPLDYSHTIQIPWNL